MNLSVNEKEDDTSNGGNDDDYDSGKDERGTTESGTA